MARAKLSFETHLVELPLAERFTIARETWDTTTNVFVTVRAGETWGIGESSPDPELDGPPESFADALAEVDLECLEGPFDLEGIADLLPAGPARAALDIALHDLAGKLAGLSVGELLGLGGRVAPPTSVTLPISSVEDMVARARRHSDHPVLKMKVGFDGDVDAVAAIRDVYDGALRIDANEGWSPDEARTRLRALEAFDIELCEQPIAAGQPDELEGVTASTSIPVFADEDVRTARDVVRLADVVDGVNLKLRKTGGIRELTRAVAVARSLGLGLMLGCDLDSGVAATAGAHVAPLFDFVDLDGPLLLAEDPWPGITYDRGRMTVPEGPGLGVRAR